MVDEQQTAQQRHRQLARTLMAACGEPAAGRVLFQFTQVIAALGEAQATALLQQAQGIEAHGGMLTQDGSRRRTLGGIFFALAKQHLRAHDPVLARAAFRRRRIRPARPVPKPQQPDGIAPMATSTRVASTWDDRALLLQEGAARERCRGEQ